MGNKYEALGAQLEKNSWIDKSDTNVPVIRLGSSGVMNDAIIIEDPEIIRKVFVELQLMVRREMIFN